MSNHTAEPNFQPKNDKVLCSESSIEKIKDILSKGNELRDQIETLINTIEPMEFESYTDYFLINTFKKGKSESGKVNVDDLRRREHSRYYKKIKRNDQNNDDKITITPPLSSSTSTNALLNDNENNVNEENKDSRRITRSSGLNQHDDSASSTTDYNMNGFDGTTRVHNSINDRFDDLNEDDEIEEVYENVPSSNSNKDISADISTASIIGPFHLDEDHENSSSTNYRRRSSRISKKEEEKKNEIKKMELLKRSMLNRKYNLGDNTIEKFDNVESDLDTDRNSNDEDDGVAIQDLYESMVQKISRPNRRSDWVLPPRFRYTPERQLRTKPVFDSIKINELVTTERISKVLSRFEGGVAGVRKREPTTFVTNTN